MKPEIQIYVYSLWYMNLCANVCVHWYIIYISYNIHEQRTTEFHMTALKTEQNTQ